MKKLLALSLIVFLLIGMVPMSISAAKVSGSVLKGTITVDGKIDAIWEAADKVMLTFNVQGIATENASAYGKFLWDSKYLYLLGVVTDSTPTPSNRDGEATWNHDSYEIFYDETNEKIDKNSMVQFRVNSLDGKVSGMIDDVVVDAKTLTDLYKGFKSATKKTADGYVVEMAIPWTKTTAKADSTQFGFCLQVNDDQDFDGSADGIITNPVANRFEPKQYPTWQLSSNEAKVGGNTSSNTSSTSHSHSYDNNCDTYCNECGAKRDVGHSYLAAHIANKTNHWLVCVFCGKKKNISAHIFDNACDNSCNVCGSVRSVSEHKYSSNGCDTKCNECGTTRKITHSYKTTTTKATLEKSGKIVEKCTECDKTTTTTTIKKIKSVKLSTTKYTYNGKAKKPTVTVKDSSGKKISSKYYTVKYESGRKKVGTYKVTVKFKGNYKGTKTLTFKIAPKSTTVSKVTAAKKSLKVKFKKQSSQTTGYEIQYSTSKKFTKSTTKTKAVKKNTTTSVTIKSLKANKKYYVRVRTYKTVDGKEYYSSWSDYKYKKTK